MTDLTPDLAELIARRFAVLGEPTRLRLLNLMHAHGEASVSDLAEWVGSAHPNVSKHLALLLNERLVARRREGTRALYRIADPALIKICDEVCAGVREQLRELSAVVDDVTVGA